MRKKRRQNKKVNQPKVEHIVQPTPEAVPVELTKGQKIKNLLFNIFSRLLGAIIVFTPIAGFIYATVEYEPIRHVVLVLLGLLCIPVIIALLMFAGLILVATYKFGLVLLTNDESWL